MIRLHSKSRQAQVFNLTHEKGPRTRLVVSVPVSTPDGAAGFKKITKRLPTSMSLLAGEVTKPLENWVGHCPDVIAAAAAKLVRIEHLPEAAAPVAATEPAPPADEITEPAVEAEASTEIPRPTSRSTRTR